MIEKFKRIVLRVDSEKWQLLDDKRHLERTTFQKLGLRLFENWLRAGRLAEINDDGNIKTTTLRDKLHTTGQKESIIGLESEEQWIAALIDIMRSGNEIAIHALKSNLVAFSGYVKAVPEADDVLADIAADEVRAAALKQRVVDARKAAAMGTTASAEKNRRAPAEEVVRKRV